MNELHATITKLGTQKKNDDKRHDDLARLVKAHSRSLASVDGLKQSFEFIMADMQISGQIQSFLTKGLPVLIHLQICEALERTVGEDYRRKIYDYEVDKTTEIGKYIKTKCSNKCLKIMHEKLQTYMRFLTEHGKGTMSFTYGEDVHSEMTVEECEFMNQSYELAI